MKTIKIVILFAAFMGIWGCKAPDQARNLTHEILKDKIAGGWAGKMIGVSYGAPTEFRAQGKMFEDTIKWLPRDIKGSLWQDDLYVQLTFLMTMDRYGIDAPPKKFQEMFAKAGYPLWHANVQARKNYFDSIFPPESGHPKYNFHADDIDFQIEADYIGFMCPGMPLKASGLCDKIGHVMNYGDGIYGGIFVAALYAEAFFDTDIPRILEKALQSIPAESDYSRIIRDVILLHSHYPADWKSAWNELEGKWGSVDICGTGTDFNIDAKLNGAYIVMGLLYGDGDPMKTLEISTRCGQDSDCNPSNALAVLGVIKGFSGLPEEMKESISAIGDSVFINTNYTFNKSVERTYLYALDFIREAGGEVTDHSIRIKVQEPLAPPLEVSFPDIVFDHRVSVFDRAGWKLNGNWETFSIVPWQGNSAHPQARFSGTAGSEAEISFEGNGIALTGNWVKDGGMADIFIDGKLMSTFDTYFFRSGQEHTDMTICHFLDLDPGKHTLKLVVKGQKRPESAGTNIYLTDALVFKKSPKKNELVKFTFQN